MSKYCVYRFTNEAGEVVYVGKSKNLEKRILNHFGNSGHLRKDQIATIVKIEYLELGSQVEMDIVELYYINKWKPVFNVQSKYDEDFTLSERENDCWTNLEFSFDEDTEKEFPSKLRVEVVLTEIDSDIIRYLEINDIPRASQFKQAVRAQIQKKQDEHLDERISRLLYGAIAELSTNTTSGDYKQAWLREKSEKERLAEELENLKETLRALIPQ